MTTQVTSCASGSDFICKWYFFRVYTPHSIQGVLILFFEFIQYDNNLKEMVLEAWLDM